MVKIDCFGEFCPIHLLKVKKAYSEIEKNDTILAVTDHSCVNESIVNHYSKINCRVCSEEVMNGVWEINITKL